jgi:hypothetical protein
MTHNGLLKRLWEKRNSGCNHLDIHFALSAIVELHPMWTDYKYTETGKELVEFCGCCQEKWPCKTIQVVEKELQ